MKTSLTLSLAGTLLAGGMIGSFIEGTSEPVRQGVLLGFGMWLATLGFLGLLVHFREWGDAPEDSIGARPQAS